MNGRRVRLSVSDSMTFNLTRFVIKKTMAMQVVA